MEKVEDRMKKMENRIIVKNRIMGSKFMTLFIKNMIKKYSWQIAFISC